MVMVLRSDSRGVGGRTVTVPGADWIIDGGWTVTVRGPESVGDEGDEGLLSKPELEPEGMGGSTVTVLAGEVGTTESPEGWEILDRPETDDVLENCVEDVLGGGGGNTVMVTGPVVGILDTVVLEWFDGQAVIVVYPRVDEEFV